MPGRTIALEQLSGLDSVGMGKGNKMSGWKEMFCWSLQQLLNILAFPANSAFTVGGIEKFPFRFRATVLPFPCNGTKTVVQRWLPFRATLRSV